MAALTYGFTIHAGFTVSGQLAALDSDFRGLRGFTLITARSFASRGFARPITRPYAHSATCVIGISHGELLSSHKRSQAWPDAPDWTVTA
jgi:hypothetical protein